MFDAGSGLIRLSHATAEAGRFPGLERVHILMDHRTNRARYQQQQQEAEARSAG